jgi:hypothetical protein
LVALVTLNCFIPLLEALAVPVLELEFMPEFAPADAVPVAEALAPVWSVEPGLVVALAEAPLLPDKVPVTCTWLPTSMRRLSRLPVNL